MLLCQFGARAATSRSLRSPSVMTGHCGRPCMLSVQHLPSLDAENDKIWSGKCGYVHWMLSWLLRGQQDGQRCGVLRRWRGSAAGLVYIRCSIWGDQTQRTTVSWSGLILSVGEQFCSTHKAYAHPTADIFYSIMIVTAVCRRPRSTTACARSHIIWRAAG